MPASARARRGSGGPCAGPVVVWRADGVPARSAVREALMQFDELCAIVGALRDRVAELEAKEAARAEREVVEPVDIRLNLTGADGSAEIRAIAERVVQAGLTAFRNRLS